MDESWPLVGTSGEIAIYAAPDTDDPAFCIQQVQLGEIVDMPDLATAREIYHLLGSAILKAEIRLHLAARGL